MALDAITWAPEGALCLGLLALLWYGTGPAVTSVSEAWWAPDPKSVLVFAVPVPEAKVPGSGVAVVEAGQSGGAHWQPSWWTPNPASPASGPNAVVCHLSWWTVIWCVLGALCVWESPLLALQAGGSFLRDSFSVGLTTALLLYAAVALAVATEWYRAAHVVHTEYLVLVMLAVLGNHLLLMSTDLMALYLCLELQSFSFVVLCSLNYSSAYAIEAGMKYFLLSAFSSCLLLLGIGLIYWDTGLTRCSYLGELLAATTLPLEGGAGGADPLNAVSEISVATLMGIWLVSLGLLWKLAAAPMHFWAADVYMGAWSSVSLLISTLPKLAVLGFWAHSWHNVWTAAFGGAAALFSAGSLLIGAVAPFAQVHMKRLLAFSSVGHMGFMLMPLAGGSEGFAALWIYLGLYLLTSVVTWGLLMWPFGRGSARGAGPQYIWDLAGLNAAYPVAAFSWGMAMLSLAGLPPAAGFLGKLGLFWWGLNAHQYALVAVALLSTLLGSVYYLRVLKIAYVDVPKSWGTLDRYAPSAAYLVAGAVVTLALALWHGAPLVLCSHLLSLVCSKQTPTPLFPSQPIYKPAGNGLLGTNVIGTSQKRKVVGVFYESPQVNP